MNSDNVTDSNSGILGYNTFLYCANNPVNASDPSGHGIFKNIMQLFSHNLKNSFGYITGFLSSVNASIGGGTGVGIQLETNISGVSVGGELSAKITDSVGVSKGNLTKETETSVNATFTVGNVINIGESTGYRHSFTNATCTCDPWNDPFGERHKCPASQKFKNVDFELGLSAGLYFGIGAEVNLGVDIVELASQWDENYKEHQEFLNDWSLFND